MVNTTNIILCHFMGWTLTDNHMCYTQSGEGFDIARYDLYHPRRMSFAWQVFQKAYNSDYHDHLEEWLHAAQPHIFSEPPEKAMEILLNEVSVLLMTRPLK